MMQSGAPTENDLAPVREPNMSKVVGVGYQPKVLREAASCKANQLLRPEGEPIPDVKVPPLGVSPNIPLEELMLQMLTANRLPLQPAISAELRNVRVGNALMGVSGGGYLADVLEELSKTLGFFYRLDKGRLSITPTKDFELALPPVPKYVENVQKLLENAGASDVYVEERSKRAFFSANRKVAERIQRHIDNWPDDMSQIIMDVSIHQVSLNDGDNFGIQWDKFSYSKNGKSVNLSGGGTGGIGALAAAINWNFGSAVSMTSIVQFLSTQGSARLVQQPKISVFSGEEALLDATTTRPYAITKTTVNNGISSTSVEMNELKLGLQTKIRPFVRNGSVYADVDLTMRELESQSMQRIGDTELPIYVTRDSQSKASLRMRDGDAVVLSGIISTRSNGGSQGVTLPIVGKVFDFQRNTGEERSELVIVLRPHVIRYEAEDGPCK